MKPKLNLIVLMLVCFTATNIKAQTVTAVFTPSHLQAAESFLEATGINTQFNKLISDIIVNFSRQVPENSRDAFIGVMQKFMQKYYT